EIGADDVVLEPAGTPSTVEPAGSAEPATSSDGAPARDPEPAQRVSAERVPAELVILAVGVRPESSLARAAGLEVDSRGAVVVDDVQRTSDPAIFAVGDVAAKRDAVSGESVVVPLAQTANRHGRLVADVITGRRTSAAPVLGTAVVGLFGLTAAVT